MITSPRYGVSHPSLDRSDAPDIPLHLNNIITGLERSVMFSQGLIVDRPVSTVGAPGIQGRVYLSTDETPMTVYWDYGTGWISVGSLSAGSIGTTQLADLAVTTAKLAANAVTSTKLADGSVLLTKVPDNTLTAAKLVDALVPTRGASGATEALRALGTAAGMAASGTHGSQHAPTGADPIQVAAAGLLASRPAAGAGNAGRLYYATDQDALYIGVGSLWVRVGVQPGAIMWTNESAAMPGYILLTGQAWPATDGIYADLFAKWGGTNLPDVQGRTFVAKGTHADVDTLLDTEGVATVANRTPKHNSSVTDPGHAHSYAVKTGGASGNYFSTVGGDPTNGNTNETGKIASAVTNITVGPGGTRPVDSGAFITLQPQAKL